MRQKSNLVSLIILLIVLAITDTLDNGLVRTPPMGWLSWERFRCNTKCNTNEDECISEKLFKDMADRLVADGYTEVGYDRINIDDCWMDKSRSKDKKLRADPKRFPNGIKYLSAYMHSKGLKLGIYQNYGMRTCMGYPGLIGFSELDAKTFAEWEVDMVKLDACFTPVHSLDKGYQEFCDHLKATGRPMVYSCSWPYYQMHTSAIVPDWNLIADNCNIWRTYHDIHANWKDILATIDFFGDNQVILNRNVGPGRWNDPDMLLIGNDGLTADQSRVQMAIWAVIAAPLFMSNDLRTIANEFKEILLNKEVIDVNQDQLGLPGERVFHNQTLDIWLRPILPEQKQKSPQDSHKSYAIAVVNRSADRPITISVRLEDLGLTQKYLIRDLFDKTDLDVLERDHNLKTTVPSTGVRLFKAILQT